MKIEECLAGQFVIIHKPIRRALEPQGWVIRRALEPQGWVDDMDKFDGCRAVIIHQGPLYVSLNNDQFPTMKTYLFNPGWLSPYQEYKPAGIESLL